MVDESSESCQLQIFDQSLVPPSLIRDMFSKALSAMFQKEVPLYKDLLSIVSDVNQSEMKSDIALSKQLSEYRQIERLHKERHGAIRLGTEGELQLVKRFFRIMGMVPVGYYDLSSAGLPVHATCFRPIDVDSLALNPFRIFASLLRPEMIASPEVQQKVSNLLSKRHIFNDRVLQLMDIADVHGGLNEDLSRNFINYSLETFAWSSASVTTSDEYELLLQESPLIADIAAFPNPHINHLTPRSLNIDAVHDEMQVRNIKARLTIEGPPRRNVPILLRQTSFYALEEEVSFRTSGTLHSTGHHTARFGEIEMRGAALTPKGRRLYDSIIASAAKKGISPQDTTAYTEHFSSFPDDVNVMREQGLVWFQYSLTDDCIGSNKSSAEYQKEVTLDLDLLIRQNQIKFEPLVYEDFLPFSAAGIFRSNIQKKPGQSSPVLGGIHKEEFGKESFEIALGERVQDEMELYRAIEKSSIDSCLEKLCTIGTRQ